MPDFNRPDRRLLIEGMGRYLPKAVIDNARLSEIAGADYHTIHERTGVVTRHFADRAAGETAPFMGAEASKKALASAGVELGDIDLIISASGTSHQFIPDQAAFIQRELGKNARGIACFSVHSSCLSFLSALDIAASHLETGRADRILIVASEFASAGLNLKDAESGPLFGDGAAACVVRARTEADSVSPQAALHRVRFETYGEDAHLTGVPGSGTHLPANDPNTPHDASTFRMHGPALLKRARRVLPNFLQSFAPGLGAPSSGAGEYDDAVFVLHQASRAGLGLVSRLGIPESQVVRTLSEYGNCVAASLPLTLFKAIESGVLVRGQRCMMLGTAAGVSYGGVLFTY